MTGDHEHDNFADVEWNQGHSSPFSPQSDSHESRPSAIRKDSNIPAQAGPDADAMDLAGVGNATLECTVTDPLKESDGTKDAYISYKVITKVCSARRVMVYICAD